MAKFNPSPYQSAIFNWVSSSETGDSLVVSAVPGSGKTTTIVEASKLIPEDKSKVFLAFNKSIATELGKKMPDTLCSTLHSISFKVVGKAIRGRLKVDGLKYHKILKDLMPKEDYYEFGTDVVKLLELAQCNLVAPTDEKLLRNYSLNPGAFEYASGVEDALRMGIRQAKNKGVVTFNDMIWLVNAMGLQPEQIDVGFIDEAQDLNAMQIDMVRKLVKTAVFVGDENQAIYGFAGALDDSMEQIRKDFKADTLPLSICYRCPKSHISLANEVFDTIEPKPRASKGVLKTGLTTGDFFDGVKGGDLVLSRVTAPLISACLTLISQGKGAYVAGRDIEKGLVNVLKKMKKMNPRFDRFEETLEAYRVVMASKMKSEEGVQAMMDKTEALLYCYTNSPTAESYADLEEETAKLFKERGRCVKLSTIHRAKGLEADRVWVFTHKLPVNYPGQPGWAKKQERNLEYVALTRSKKELFLVDNSEV